MLAVSENSFKIGRGIKNEGKKCGMDDKSLGLMFR